MRRWDMVRARVTLALALLTPSTALARDVPVSTVSGLQAALAGAQPGDVIRLADGTYSSSGLSCAASGTAQQPIVVRSESPLGAKIRFDGVEGFKVTGAHWHFEGLDVIGVCANDSTCEHAFHVMGAAVGFVLRGSRVVDFNAQLKVNATLVQGAWASPHGGLVEGNELYDTRARNTANPTTKLNIDTGDDWVLRANYLHDFQKGGGNTISYGAFLKSGGKRGLLERNLVVCTSKAPPHTGGTRIGLSLGGGGTAPQFCAPAFDANVPCDVEHEGGTLRNNVIIGCSDVGIYLNRAKGSHVAFNTLVATAGVDFRFSTTSGDAVGNVLAGVVRNRDGATGSFSGNLSNVSAQQFASWYLDPLGADLRKQGDLQALLGQGPADPTVTDDYCARPRGAGPKSFGALEHALGDCDTTRPLWPGTAPLPDGGLPATGDAGGALPQDAGGGASGSGGGSAIDAGAAGGGAPPASGCSLAARGGLRPGGSGLFLFALLGALLGGHRAARQLRRPVRRGDAARTG